MNSVQNPAYQAGMEARFAIAARHSRMVRVLRVAVPAAVVLAMAGIVAVSIFNPFRMLLPHLPVDMGNLVVSGTKITMETPHMAGYTPDRRPWLDHGRWGVGHPLGMRRADGTAPPYAFLAAEGEGLHQIAVGPVHAGIIEPGHFRFTASGEAVVRLEQRLGYAHKGIEGLMAGAPLARAAALAGRVSGDSVVAYGIAFARAA